MNSDYTSKDVSLHVGYLSCLDAGFNRDLSIAPCKGIRIPESMNFVLVESGILGFGIQNPALRIRNPTKDWNPESNLLKIHSRLN